MRARHVYVSTSNVSEQQFYICRSIWSRLRGLLGTKPTTQPVLLIPCNAIHTFGMSYDIDIAFVSKRGEVIYSEHALGRCRTVACKDAFAVLERPTSTVPWFTKGEHLTLYCEGRHMRLRYLSER